MILDFDHQQGLLKPAHNRIYDMDCPKQHICPQ